ncbi:MAG: cell division protein FtsA [Ichthyobacteriaceae bacterium]|nr:cell division protein FtsA [Ichthyobacteriaceae bacterium]
MKNSNIAVGLDIGTTKVAAIVGRRNDHGKIEVLAVGKTRSLGVNRGMVNNITKTIESIKLAIEDVEVKSGKKIDKVVVGIAGQHIRSIQHSDYIMRENSDDVITQEDIDHLIKQVHKLVMLPGEQIIHVLPQEYRIDYVEDIKDPIGMSGARIEASFHVVVGNISSIKNIGRCVTNSGLKVHDVTLEPIASAESVLSEEEKEAGVALIDIGGGTTDLAIFKDGIIRHSAVIPFGGNIITDDIKEGCSIIEKQAEQLKVRFGSAWPGEMSDNEIVSIPGLRGREPKEVTMRNLSQIISARVREIISQVFQEIKNYGYEEPRKKLIAGIVLTGGGAQLNHMQQIVEYITGIDTRVGVPTEHLDGGSEGELKSPLYATAVGLLIKGIQNNEEKDRQTIVNDIPELQEEDDSVIVVDPEPKIVETIFSEPVIVEPETVIEEKVEVKEIIGEIEESVVIEPVFVPKPPNVLVEGGEDVDVEVPIEKTEEKSKNIMESLLDKFMRFLETE